MEIALDRAMEVIHREPDLVNSLFTNAYLHNYVRDDAGTNITRNPRRVIFFFRTVAVMSKQFDRLSVESISAIPEQFEAHDLMGSPPSVEELVQLLGVSHFHVIDIDLISFQYFGQKYFCRFSSDYARWSLHSNPKGLG